MVEDLIEKCSEHMKEFAPGLQFTCQTTFIHCSLKKVFPVGNMKNTKFSLLTWKVISLHNEQLSQYVALK